jgi:hypothetical protein
MEFNLDAEYGQVEPRARKIEAGMSALLDRMRRP